MYRMLEPSLQSMGILKLGVPSHPISGLKQNQAKNSKRIIVAEDVDPRPISNRIFRAEASKNSRTIEDWIRKRENALSLKSNCRLTHLAGGHSKRIQARAFAFSILTSESAASTECPIQAWFEALRRIDDLSFYVPFLVRGLTR